LTAKSLAAVTAAYDANGNRTNDGTGLVCLGRKEIIRSGS